MNGEFQEIFQKLARPMEPIPTGERSVLRELPGIRAVLFDVYGTLVASASGEVGMAGGNARGESFVAALAAMGIPFSGSGISGLACFQAAIEEEHQRQLGRGKV